MPTELQPDERTEKPVAEPLTAAEQKQLEEIEARFDDDQPQPQRPNRTEQVKNASNFYKKNKKWFVGGGISLGVLIPIVMFFFWMMAFKNVHIKNLYVTYRWAQFNRGLTRNLKAQLEYARNTPGAEVAGAADTTITSTNAPDEIMKKANASELAPDATKPLTPAELEAKGKKVTYVEESIEGSSEKTLRESGANRTVKPAEGTGDTPEERAKNAQEKANANVEEDIGKNRGLEGNAPETLKDGIEESKNQQEAGKTPAQAAEEGATKVLEGGGRWAGAVRVAGGIFNTVSFYCIFRDIYVSAKEQVNKIALSGAAAVSQEVNKVADCQKLGKCYANQIGAVAEKFDNATESFTETCGYTRATQSSNPACKEIDPQFIVNGLVKQVNETAGTAITTADTLLDPPFPGVGAVCSKVMNPVAQGGFALVNLAAIAGTGGGWGAVSQSVAGGAAAFAATAGGKALIASTILKYTGDHYKDLNPFDMGNLNDMGNMVTASGSCMTAWCPQASDAQVAQLDRDYRTERIAANSKRSVLEKFFDNDSPDSVVSRVVLNAPVTPSAVIGKLKTVFASITNPARLNLALGNNSLAVAGVQSAYAADDGANAYGLSNKAAVPPNLLPGSSSHAEVLAWGKRGAKDALESKYSKCGGESGEAYDKRVSSDDGTCMWDNLDAEGKMFFQYKYAQNVAAKTALAHNNQTNSSGSKGGGSAAPSAPSGNAQDIAKQILANPQITLTTPAAKASMEAVANGQLAPVNCKQNNGGGTSLDPVLLGALQQVSQQYSMGIGYITNGCHSANSKHYRGKAVDINTINNQEANGDNQLSWDFLSALSQFLPDGSGYGQLQCGVKEHVRFAHNIRVFADPCTHIHVDVQ